MKKVIYIGTGVVSASVNVINAGCCNKDEDKNKGTKSLSIEDIKISLEGGNFSKDAGKWNDVVLRLLDPNWCKFDEAVASKDIVFFHGIIGSSVSVYAYVCTEEFYKKLDPQLSADSKIKKLGNTSYYISIAVRGGKKGGTPGSGSIPVAVIGNNPGNVKIEIVDEKNLKFKIVVVE